METLWPVFSVFFVFALLGATLWWLRRRGTAQFKPLLNLRTKKAASGKLLQRVEALPLSPTHTLNLVRLGDRAILIGASPAGFHLVESAPWKTLESKETEQ